MKKKKKTEEPTKKPTPDIRNYTRPDPVVVIEANAIEELRARVKVQSGLSLDILDVHVQRSKLDRNAKCPCNSGKKFKRCCIAKATRYWVEVPEKEIDAHKKETTTEKPKATVVDAV